MRLREKYDLLVFIITQWYGDTCNPYNRLFLAKRKETNRNEWWWSWMQKLKIGKKDENNRKMRLQCPSAEQRGTLRQLYSRSVSIRNKFFLAPLIFVSEIRFLFTYTFFQLNKQQRNSKLRGSFHYFLSCVIINDLLFNCKYT